MRPQGRSIADARLPLRLVPQGSNGGACARRRRRLRLGLGRINYYDKGDCAPRLHIIDNHEGHGGACVGRDSALGTRRRECQ